MRAPRPRGVKRRSGSGSISMHAAVRRDVCSASPRHGQKGHKYATEEAGQGASLPRRQAADPMALEGVRPIGGLKRGQDDILWAEALRPTRSVRVE